MRIDVATLRRHVEALQVAHPEIAEDEILRLDTLEGETDLFEVLTHVLREEQLAKANAAAVAAYMSDLAARKERFARKQEAARELIMKIMDAAGVRKAPLAEATLSINAGRQKVFITDEAAIPEAFTVVKRSPDKTAINEALKAGEDVPGAALANGEPTLSIRVA